MNHQSYWVDIETLLFIINHQNQNIINRSQIISIYCIFNISRLLYLQHQHILYLQHQSNKIYKLIKAETINGHVSKKKCDLKSFANFTGKHLCQRFFLIMLQATTLVKKRLRHRCFSCKFCEVLKNIYFAEHLWKTTDTTGHSINNLFFSWPQTKNQPPTIISNNQQCYTYTHASRPICTFYFAFFCVIQVCISNISFHIYLTRYPYPPMPVVFLH